MPCCPWHHRHRPGQHVPSCWGSSSASPLPIGMQNVALDDQHLEILVQDKCDILFEDKAAINNGYAILVIRCKLDGRRKFQKHHLLTITDFGCLGNSPCLWTLHPPLSKLIANDELNTNPEIFHPPYEITSVGHGANYHWYEQPQLEGVPVCLPCTNQLGKETGDRVHA